MNKNIALFIENVFVWSGVVMAYTVALLPLMQFIAAFAAFGFSLLSIIKIIKNWSKNNN